MARARLEGEQLGKMREQTLILSLLKRRLGNVPNDLEVQIGSLPIDFAMSINIWSAFLG